MRGRTIKHEFVEFIPEILEEGTLYISIPYGTAVHKCFCGCGNEVVTPLSPTDWELSYNGKTVSLNPSVGSWSLDCKSHYWIRRNRIEWAAHWAPEEIRAARGAERAEKERYYSQGQVAGEALPERRRKSLGLWDRVRRLLGRRR